MGRWTWWVIGIGLAYFLFYLGGNYSFRYTHVCTHSHRETIYSETNHPSTSVVCDRYSGNARKWSFGDPVRAVPSERFIKWDGMAIGGFVVVIGAATFLEWRRRKNRPPDSGVMHATPKT